MALRPMRQCRCGHIHRETRCPRCVQQYEQQRGSARNRGYTSAWDKASAAYLRAHPFCVLCGQPSEVTDHIVAHKGDMRLFWDKRNWQALCGRCNRAKGIRQEGGFGR